MREGERGRCQQQNGHMFPGGGPGSRARTSPRAGGRRASPALGSSLQSRPYVIAGEALDRGWQQAIKPADRERATSQARQAACKTQGGIAGNAGFHNIRDAAPSPPSEASDTQRGYTYAPVARIAAGARRPRGRSRLAAKAGRKEGCRRLGKPRGACGMKNPKAKAKCGAVLHGGPMPIRVRGAVAVRATALGAARWEHSRRWRGGRGHHAD